VDILGNLKKLFSKQDEPKVGPMPEADHEIGGGWGYHISWALGVKWDGINKNSILKATGHLPPRLMPKKGETLRGEFVNSWIVFEVVNVERERDPPDMFWLDVKPVLQVLKGASDD